MAGSFTGLVAAYVPCKTLALTDYCFTFSGTRRYGGQPTVRRVPHKREKGREGEEKKNQEVLWVYLMGKTQITYF